MILADVQESINLSYQPQTQPLQLTVIKEWEALRSRKMEWDALVKQSEINTVFQTFGWHASWWKAFGEKYQLRVLLAEAAGELVGIAPLMLSTQRLLGQRRRVLEFIGAPLGSDYCDFITDQAQPEVLPLLLQWLVEHDQQWEVLKLADIPGSSPTLEMLPVFFQQRGYRSDKRVLYEAPTRLFGDPVADQALLNKKSLRRHSNYFRRNGQLEFKNCRSSEEITPHLELFFEQHIQRRALTDSPSQFLDERQRTFYRELVQQLAPTGALLFSIVLYNQRPLAFHLGFEYDSRIIWYKPTFDVNYTKHSPGEVLLKYLLQYALDRGASEFDFTIGEEAFKYRFANHVRLNYGIRVFRHSTSYYTERMWLDTKALIKQSPALARLGRASLRHWQNFRFREESSK